MKKRKLKKKFKFSMITVVALAIFATLTNLSVRADGNEVYDANSWDTFKNRTREEIAEKYGETLKAGATYVDGDASTYYEVTPSLEDPATVGKLTTDTHEAMTEMTNFYRWLVGSNPLTRTSKHSDALQAGALIRPNSNYGHKLTPDQKPDDVPQDIWDQGANVEHNILSWFATPRGSIENWLDEGYNASTKTFDTVGHREMLISPIVSTVDYGYANKTAIGVVGLSGTRTNPYTAYPAPGYMPNNEISTRYSGWSIELNPSVISYNTLSDITVTVTNLDTSESYDCTSANGKLSTDSIINNIMPTLIFAQPEVSSYATGDKYKVEVTGLKDVSTKNSAEITYTIEFFDVKDYMETTVESATIKDRYTKVNINNSENNTEDLEKIASILPEELEIVTESGKRVTIPTTGEWTVDEENNCFIAKGDASKLPENIKDTSNVLDRVELPYEVTPYAGRLTADNYNPTESTSGEITMHRYMQASNNYLLYQVTDNKSIMRFDKDSKNTTVDGAYANYTIDSYTLSDTGSYVGFYYVSGYQAYVAGIIDINVKEKEIKSISINGLPKNTYKIGEDLEITDVLLNITYEDDTSSSTPLIQDMITNTPTEKKGLQEVEITYQGKKTTTTILVVDNPASIEAEYGDTLADITIPEDENGTYSFQDNKTTSVGETGTKKFKVTYTPKDSNYSKVTNLEIEVNVLPGEPSYSTTITTEATYGDTLADIKLPESEYGTYEFEQLLATPVGNAGTSEGVFTVKFTPNDTKNYKTVTNIPVIINIKKKTPAYEIPSNLEAGYGDKLADVLLPENFTWNNPEQSVGEIGTNKFLATYTPIDTNNYEIVENIEIPVKVGKATPEYTVPENLTATYGDTLKEVILPTSTTGTYQFVKDASTKVGDAGINIFEVKFIPNDTNYREVTMEVEITVQKKNPEYTVPENLTATYGDTLGTITLPKAENGTFEWMTENSTKVGNAGIQTWMVKFIPNDTKNYNTIENIEVSIQVEKANPTYSIPTNLKAEYGDTLEDITLPAGFTWKDKTTSVGEVGTGTFTAIYTPEDTKNYNTVEVTLEVQVEKQTPEFEELENLTATYGDTLADIKLPESNLGKFEWQDNPNTSVGNAGEHIFKVDFIPNDEENYERVEGIEVIIKVNKKKADSVEIPQLAEITYDQNQTLNDIKLPGCWTWDNPNTTPTVDNTGYKATYTPEDTLNYDYSNQNLNPTLTLIVKKATPVFMNPTVTSYAGQTLAEVMLPTLSNGKFVWNDPLTTSVGNTGTKTFTATFIPNDTTNYETVDNVQVTVEVGKALPDYTIPTNITATYGDILKDINLPEGFTWNNEEESVGNAGTKTFLATYTPEDTTNYATVTNIEIEVIVNKKKADPVEIPQLEEITYDENQTLNDIALPEGWTWDNPNTTPTVDNTGYKATYTPEDTLNYDYSNQNLNPTLTLIVKKATPVFMNPTVTSYAGQTLAEVMLPTLSNGKFVWNDPLTTSVGNTGTKTFTATFIPNDTTNYETVDNVQVTVEVGKALPDYTIPTNITATYGDILKDINLPEGFTWNNEEESVGNAGTKTFLATYTPEDTTNYATVTNIEIEVIVNKKKADPVEIPQLEEITYDENQTLNDIALPEGWTWDNPNTTPTVNNSGYKATYTPEDTLNYDYSSENLNPTLTLKVTKKDPIFKTPLDITIPYGTKLEDIELPKGFTWEDTGLVGEIGTHTYKVTYTPEDTNNYNSINNIEVTVIVEKANPTTPEVNNIKIEKQEDLTLANIPLPGGWTWENPNTKVTTSGYYKIVFTPEDKEHYNTITKEIYIELEDEETLTDTENRVNIDTQKVPNTEDNIILWLSIFLLSITSITGVGLYTKFRKN